MTGQTKIALSDNELELVCDKEWILTKHIIIDKVYHLFGALSLEMQQHTKKLALSLPAAVTEASPKISKGENYRQLPYVMLDYPRYFKKEDTLAIRTLFWWGNFFSINLHVSGRCKAVMIPAIQLNFQSLQEKDYYVCIHADPWQHHFEEDNYVPLKKYTADQFAAMLYREPFIKIAKMIPLQQWDAAHDFLEQHFIEMINLLKINYLNGETDL